MWNMSKHVSDDNIDISWQSTQDATHTKAGVIDEVDERSADL